MEQVNIHKEEVEIKIHEKESENDLTNHWKSCCFELDKRSTVFFSTYTMSLILVFFCIYKLAGELPCPEQNAYIGLLTLIIGVYIKTPEM